MDIINYADSIGFFDNLQLILPQNFYILFEIARNIFTDEVSSEALNAIEEITRDEKILQPDRDESIEINRMEKVVPLSDKMEIDTYKNIYDLKKALPRELALDDDIFDVKLFTKTLIVQKNYESESDSFKPISTSQNETGKDANRFEQKFYILMDRSKSMDMKIRSYYAKCIVVEFLRRKLNSNARLYYRAFDSKIGNLFRIEKKEDFPQLIENVLLTTTGGKSTNLQGAIYQAISDINYDKEMTNSEILVVTDGISRIDKYEMREKLGKIRLNVLKIGDEMAEENFYDLKSDFDQEEIGFDPGSINVKQAKKVLESDCNDNYESVSMATRRAYRLILDHSDSIFQDLKEVSFKFINIADFDYDGGFEVSDDNMDNIKKLIQKFQNIDFNSGDIDLLKKVYKQIYFFSQYIQQLLDVNKKTAPRLQKFLDDLTELKQKMLKNPYLLISIMEVKELGDDKKIMKLAKKDAKMMMKQMKMQQKNISIKDMKRAQLVFTGDVGKGSMGQFILLLLVKLGQFIKRIIFSPFNKNDAENSEKK